MSLSTKFIVILASMAVAAIAAAMPNAASKQQQRLDGYNRDCDKKVDVAIVGAGPSGAYSGYKLRNLNLSVELFERSALVGGRLFESYLDHAPKFRGLVFRPDTHPIAAHLITELGLKIQSFPLHGGSRFNNKFYLRGKHVTEDDVTSGNIPYGLNSEEKSNQGRLLRYYLEKLTGYNGTEETRDIFLQLQVPDGRFLYQVPFDEAFDMVASPEGKAFVKETTVYESDTAADTSVLTVFINNLGQNSGDYQMMYVKEQDALPRQLVKTFLESNKRFKLNLNRRLVSLVRGGEGYMLRFAQTRSLDGHTYDTEGVELVCARKIVLATSKAALQQIEWKVLREERMANALKALREVPTAQIFMSFPRPWWLQNATNPTAMTTTDLPFKEALDWGRSEDSGNYLLLASYADESKALRMALLNEVGAPAPISVPGAGVVSEALITELLKELADAHGVERGAIPDPTDATAQFWTPGRTGGGRVVWRAGNNYDDVTAILQRPSVEDDVFVVGADFSAGYNEGFAESAFETVEKVFPLLFSRS